MGIVGTTFDLLKQTWREWNQDKVPRLAAALAYYIAFSLAPLLVLTIAVGGFLLREQFVRNEIMSIVAETVGLQAAELVAGLIDNLREPTSGILSTVLGLGALIFGALSAFDQLKAALNTVWGVPEERIPSGARGFILGKLMSFGMVLMIGLLLLMSLILTTLLSLFDTFIASQLPGADVLLGVLNALIPLALITALFAMIYRFLPDIRLQWRDVWIGALITAVLFTIGKTALGLYLGRAGATSAYGAAGSFVLILLWIYYSAQIVLLGAEFTQVYSRKYGSLAEPDSPASQDLRKVAESGRVSPGAEVAANT